MTIAELHDMNFNDAAEKLYQENDSVTTYDSLVDFAIYKIKEQEIFVAIHILSAINENPADYYDYDYCMGTLDTPTPLLVSADLEDYCENGGNR